MRENHQLAKRVVVQGDNHTRERQPSFCATMDARLAANVSAAHEVPEPTEGRRRDFRAHPERYPFTTCAASGAKRRAA
jgi:hypothetical protein